MPYIKKQRRKDLWEEGIVGEPGNAGELNYLITSVILDYLHNKRVLTDKKMFNNYTDYNEVMGVLECCKQELYRKVISKYEDKKERENGDVFNG